LIRDTKVILDLTVDQLSAIALELSTAAGFMDADALRAVLASHIQKEDQVQSLFRVISSLDNFIQSPGQPSDVFLSRIKEALSKIPKEMFSVFTDAEYEELRRRLPIIAKRYPAFHRFTKAKRLSEATGMLLEDVQIICDVRPVFDE